MNQESSQNHQQSIGNTTTSGQENRTAITQGNGDVNIDQSIIIHNSYYYDKKIIASTDSFEESDDLPCPYRGLFHFRPEDAKYFFGRDKFIAELYQATRTRNFIPLLGASGSGKSSVVFAGLVPKLKREGHWQFTYFRPGEDPFHALALGLLPLYAQKLDETEHLIQSRKLAKALREKEIPLGDVFAKIHQNHPQERILLIADQFEELFTLGGDSAIQRQFLDTLLTPFQSEEKSASSTVLVATMRADFLGNALSHPPFAEVLKTDIKLGAMNAEELREVIEKPAQKLGVTFEQGLVERILDDVEQEPGNLPLLEFALTELWKKRTQTQQDLNIRPLNLKIEGSEGQNQLTQL